MSEVSYSPPSILTQAALVSLASANSQKIIDSLAQSPRSDHRVDAVLPINALEYADPQILRSGDDQSQARASDPPTGDTPPPQNQPAADPVAGQVPAEHVAAFERGAEMIAAMREEFLKSPPDHPRSEQKRTIKTRRTEDKAIVKAAKLGKRIDEALRNDAPLDLHRTVSHKPKKVFSHRKQKAAPRKRAARTRATHSHTSHGGAREAADDGSGPKAKWAWYGGSGQVYRVLIEGRDADRFSGVAVTVERNGIKTPVVLGNLIRFRNGSKDCTPAALYNFRLAPPFPSRRATS
jgi:hypothetical protein